MPYYPKSQIKNNLYTTGGEFQNPSFPQDPKGYTGPYYETSSGNKYTGKFPGDGNNTLLSKFLLYENPLLEEPQTLEINDNLIKFPFSPQDPDPYGVTETEKYSPPNSSLLNTIPVQLRKIPQFYTPMLTQQEKDQGYLTRYFCKKGNEIKYIEISKEDFNKLQSRSNDIAWDLYDPFSIKWLIKGNKEEVFKSNKGAVAFEERKNRRLGLSQYLRNNFTKYYLES